MGKQLTGRALVVALTCLSILVIISKGAYAYIDPGTGSYVLQAAIAGLLAAGFVIRSTWRNIKEGLAKRFAKRDTDAK